MAVSDEAELSFIHIGVPSMYQGDPDGFFSGLSSLVHDASGGSAVHVINATGVGEIMLKILNITAWNPSGTTVTGNTVIGLVSPSHLYPEAQDPEVGDGGGGLTAGIVRARDYPEGLWYWLPNLSAAQPARVLNVNLSNVNGAQTLVAISGWYWRMTRLRMHATKDWRRPAGRLPGGYWTTN